MKHERFLLKRIRLLIGLFMTGTVISGLTAFPLEWEVKILAKMVVPFARVFPSLGTGLMNWILRLLEGVVMTNQNYPFMAYGTDWLAFGHIVIALAFIGVLRDPLRNVWIVEWGMIACVLVIPLAMICGPIRGIPFYWRLIDCSFGVIGFILLWLSWKSIRQLTTESQRAQRVSL